MKKVNYQSNITGWVKLLKPTKFTNGQLKCLKKTPFWLIFDCLISNEVDLNHCMKYDNVIVRIVQTFKPLSGRFYIRDKSIQIFKMYHLFLGWTVAPSQWTSLMVQNQRPTSYTECARMSVG
ncbi:hypothetical protein CsSME_00026629 [Camellia sinensis var. sinensis]